MFFFHHLFFLIHSIQKEIRLLAEYIGNDRSKNVDDVLGPIPTNKTLFRNKFFILTCTIPMKKQRQALNGSSASVCLFF